MMLAGYLGLIAFVCLAPDMTHLLRQSIGIMCFSAAVTNALIAVVRYFL